MPPKSQPNPPASPVRTRSKKRPRDEVQLTKDDEYESDPEFSAGEGDGWESSDGDSDGDNDEGRPPAPEKSGDNELEMVKPSAFELSLLADMLERYLATHPPKALNLMVRHVLPNRNSVERYLGTKELKVVNGLVTIMTAPTAPTTADFFERLPSTFSGDEWVVYFILVRQPSDVDVPRPNMPDEVYVGSAAGNMLDYQRGRSLPRFVSQAYGFGNPTSKS